MPTQIDLSVVFATAIAAVVTTEVSFGDGSPMPPKKPPQIASEVSFGDGSPMPPKKPPQIASTDLHVAA